MSLESPDEVHKEKGEWYEYQDVITETGETVTEAVYDKCSDCGLTAEAWPLLAWEQIVFQYGQGGIFVVAFNAAKAALSDRSKVRFAPGHVGTQTLLGLQMYSKYWFIENKHC